MPPPLVEIRPEKAGMKGKSAKTAPIFTGVIFLVFLILFYKHKYIVRQEKYLKDTINVPEIAHWGFVRAAAYPPTALISWQGADQKENSDNGIC